MSQSNVPVVAPRSMSNLAVPVPPQLLAQLVGNFAGAYDDFGSQFRSISLKGNRFTLREAGSETTLPGNDLMVVILGMGPHNHCVYYKDAYTPGKTDIQPTAVWYANTTPPPNVPATALQKQANGFLGYQIRRRLVVAILQQNQSTGEYYVDLDNPYVLDAGSQSIFGEDYPAQMAFTLAGLTRYCVRNRIMPLQFVTRLIFDTHKSTPALRFIPHNSNGQVQYLDEATLGRVSEAAVAPYVKDLLPVKLIPDTEDAAVVEVIQPRVDPVPQQVYAPEPEPEEAQIVGQPMAAPITITPPTPTVTQLTPQAAPQPQPQPAPVQPSEATEADNILQQAAQAAEAAKVTIEVQPSAPEQPAASTTSSALADLLARAGNYAQ